MAGRLEGKVALITGGISGIGEATVELFVAQGAKVMIAARSDDKGQKMVGALGANTRFIKTDVTKEADTKAAIDATVAAFGRMDILFNNAGGGTPGELETVTPENFHYALDLLLGSVRFGIKNAAPVMKAQGRGAIINNVSVASNSAHMGDYLYSVAKAGVVQLTKMAGMELGRHSITVNCISPGAVATPIFFGGHSAVTPEAAEGKMRRLRDNLSKATPLRRSGLPIDIAQAALFLGSDEGAYINCHDLVVDGGMTFGGRTNYETPEEQAAAREQARSAG
jgi:NAD(P)-dependent dehydrogenase (short-subunit alcohol dehydrogenase family)